MATNYEHEINVRTIGDNGNTEIAAIDMMAMEFIAWPGILCVDPVDADSIRLTLKRSLKVRSVKAELRKMAQKYNCTVRFSAKKIETVDFGEF
jgi:hypothetical protein